MKTEVKEEDMEIKVKVEEVEIRVKEEEESSLVAVPTKQESESSSPSLQATSRPAAFAYGLQPFKAVHSVVPNVRNFLSLGIFKLMLYFNTECLCM